MFEVILLAFSFGYTGFSLWFFGDSTRLRNVSLVILRILFLNIWLPVVFSFYLRLLVELCLYHGYTTIILGIYHGYTTIILGLYHGSTDFFFWFFGDSTRLRNVSLVVSGNSFLKYTVTKNLYGYQELIWLPRTYMVTKNLYSYQELIWLPRTYIVTNRHIQLLV